MLEWAGFGLKAHTALHAGGTVQDDDVTRDAKLGS
jgi:hypothetical protein